MKDWMNRSRAICSATTKANFINDHMIFHAKDKLGHHPNVGFVRRHGRMRLLVGDRLEIKLKKLDHNRRPSNILTQAVIDFHDQETQAYQFEFPDMRYPIANLIAGYQQNRMKTGIEAVYVVCPQGSRNSWEWRMEFALEPSKAVPIEPTTPSAKPKIVTPKKRLAKSGLR